MLSFKTIKNEYGDKVVVNLASIDAIIHHANETATVRLRDLQISVHKHTAEYLEKQLGATA